MITTINNEHKELNFSSEREQSQACLNSAEHEKNQGRKVLNVPNLRFPEFQGEWEEYRIEDITENISSGRCKSHSPNGKYNLYGSTGIIGKTDEACYEGNLVLVARVGANAGSLQIINELCGITDNTLIIKPKEVNAQYLYFFLQHFNLNRLIFGSGQPLITGGMLKKVKVSLGTVQEQNKLTKLLSLLDERIATQNKIIEDLKKLKSAIIDYAINSLNTDFAKFDSLYEMAGEGGTPTTSNASFYDNGKIPFIKIDDLKKKYLTENKDFIAELGLQKSSAWLVPTRSILFSNGATIGEISITTYPVCTKQGILGIVPKQNIDVEFLYYFMSSSYFKKAVSCIVTEGTMKTAYLKDINNILCPIPTKEKQQEIAKMPSALNSKIDFEQSILKLFCSQKRHLLRQMFI